MIAVFGEVLIDCLPTGNVVGGAPFNVAMHLDYYGHELAFVSRIGKDAFGEEVNELVKGSSLGRYLRQDTLYKTGYVSVAFEDGEPQYTIHSNVAWQYIEVPEDLHADYIVFGSLATFFEKNKQSLLQLMAQSPRAVRFCDINLRQPFYSEEHVKFCLENTDILKLNEHEETYLQKLFGFDSTVELVQLLLEKYGIQTVLTTRGDRDVQVFSEEEVLSIDVVRVSEAAFKDSIGAGDAFAATYIDASLRGASLPDAVKKAVVYAAEICKVQGALPKRGE